MAIREYLFHQKRFVYRNGYDQVYSFENDYVGIDFYDVEDAFISIPKSTFGGPFFSDVASSDDIKKVLNQAEQFARENLKRVMLVRCAPELYHIRNATINKEAFEASGYQIQVEDVDYSLLVKHHYMQNVHRSKQKIVREAFSGRYAYRWLTLDYFKQSYEQWSDTRIRKGYVMSMSYEESKRMFLDFSSEYQIFGVLMDEKLLASALIIKISPSIWYVMYWGDEVSVRNNSPITSLITALYREAFSANVALLDLGTASHHGILNEGVSFFKTTLGAIPNKMITWRKIISNNA
jgi:hypothetical protein